MATVCGGGCSGRAYTVRGYERDSSERVLLWTVFLAYVQGGLCIWLAWVAGRVYAKLRRGRLVSSRARRTSRISGADSLPALSARAHLDSVGACGRICHRDGVRGCDSVRSTRPGMELRGASWHGWYLASMACSVAPYTRGCMDTVCVVVPRAVLWAEASLVHVYFPCSVWRSGTVGGRHVLLASG